MTAQKFIHWAAGLQEQRLPILAGMLTVHGCITVPVTMVLMHFAGLEMFQFSLVIIATFSILVTNLAALPTKITVPTFIMANIVHLGVILVSIADILIG